MEKKIGTGTEITFTKTNDKFELFQNPTGFDVKPIKLSKSIPTEPYTFQELLDLYEAKKITIEGFEEADASHVRSILTSYIHQSIVKDQLVQIDKLTAKNSELTAKNAELTTKNAELTAKNAELTTKNAELTTKNAELTTKNAELTAKNEQLNTALAAMPDNE